MSDKASLFSKIKEKYKDLITLGVKGKCKILGIGRFGKDSSKCIDNVIWLMV